MRLKSGKRGFQAVNGDCFSCAVLCGQRVFALQTVCTAGEVILEVSHIDVIGIDMSWSRLRP